MTRKRRKQKDPLTHLLGLLIVGVYIFSYMLTDSLEITAKITGSFIGVILGIGLVRTVLKFKAKPHPKNNFQPICDRCGNIMVIRRGPRGEFYGCSRFPKCRNTKNIDAI